MTHWSESLPRRACAPAVAWASTQESFAAAWAACARGDWMAWLLDTLGLPVPTEAWRVYDAAVAGPGRAYDAAVAGPGRAYDAAVAEAERAFDAAMAAPRRAYADAIRAAVPAETVAAALARRVS